MRHERLVKLHDLAELLKDREGMTRKEIVATLQISDSTAKRLLRALELAGYTVEYTHRDYAKVYRIAKKTSLQAIGIPTHTMAVLFLARSVFGFLRGTGFKEDLDAFFARVERALSYKDLVLARALDRKLYDYDEMPHVYENRAEDIDVLVNALLKEERIDLRHAGIGRGEASHVFELYTLLVYKKGVYLIGKTVEDGAMHRLALDEVLEVDRRRGDRFAYPKDYDPKRFLGDPFGIRRGKREKVVLRFRAHVAKYVKRRRVHSTQKLIDEPDGSLLLEMTPEGFDQLDSYVLEYRDNVEVLEPAWFREEIARQITRMGALYGLRLAP